jgi:hypothetical protein
MLVFLWLGGAVELLCVLSIAALDHGSLVAGKLRPKKARPVSCSVSVYGVPHGMFVLCFQDHDGACHAYQSYGYAHRWHVCVL